MNETKYWLHKFDKDLLRQLDHFKILGAKNKNSRSIKPIEKNDKIIIFTTLEVDETPLICFIAYTMVADTFNDENKLYNKYESLKKLKLKGIKYFTSPVIAKDASTELNFIKNPKKSSNYFSSEFREINENDFMTILRKTSGSKSLPARFNEISFNMDNFLLNSIKGLYYILKNEKRNQIEIKLFITFLKDLLFQYGISISKEELEDFYSKNAWKLGFKHTPSRDPDKYIILYNKNGKKNRFSYINLN